MAILTTDELLTLVPSLSSSSEEDLNMAIATCTFAIESPEGANRKLEFTDYSEIKKLRLVHRQVALSYYPIVEIDTVYIRGEILTEFQRTLNSLAWVELDSQYYQLEPNGVLTFNIDTPVRKRTYHKPIEVKVNYSAGFDFTEANPDTTLIKTLLAKCCQFQLSDKSSNIRAMSVSDEYSVTYGNDDLTQFGVPKNYLTAFKKYAPRKTNG